MFTRTVSNHSLNLTFPRLRTVMFTAKGKSVAKSVSIFSACTAATFVGCGSAQALTSTFSLNTASPTNGVSRVFTSNGINLTVNAALGGPFPAGEGVPPVTGGINTNFGGLCTWMVQSVSTGRCNFDAIPQPRNATLTGYSFTFDKDVTLKSFDVSMFQNLTSGSVSFVSGLQSSSFSFGSMGIQNFPTNFSVKSGTLINITSTGTLASGVDNGVYRIDQLTVETADVPGPLPILGAAAAFSYSRKLRNRISQHS